MAPIPGDEHGRDGAVADEIDPSAGGGRPVAPREGLADPEDGAEPPASEMAAPPPG
jgi:hypothetical protein